MQINSMDAMSKSIDKSYERVTQTEQPVARMETMQAQQKYETPQKQEAQQPQISNGFVKMAVDKANKQMKMRNSSLEFSVHERLHEMIVRVIDSDTKEVIREIPSEKMLDMVANMLEMAGILVDESI